MLSQVANGDEVAFDKILCANLRFTLCIAKHYQHNGLSLLQLLDISKPGLANAIMESASKPIDQCFIQFAVPYMRKVIVEAISALDDRSEEKE